MKKYLLFLAIISSFISGYSQNFEKFLGGSLEDNFYSVQQTTDGGYICTGQYFSNDGDLNNIACNTNESAKTWIVKLNHAGSLQWQHCLSTQMFYPQIQKTNDGGYIVAGGGGGGLPGNHGAGDFHIVKLDYVGNIQWQKLFGSSEGEAVYSIQQTKDGGYILAGETEGNNGDVTGNHGALDIWIVKLSDSGHVEWKKCLGGSAYERANSIEQTTDGGYIIAGVTDSNDGDVNENHGAIDAWIIKLNKKGNIQWQKCYGGSASDEAYSIQQINGGYIFSGASVSNDGDVNGNHGNGDMWIVKLNQRGHIQWQKCLGSSRWENAVIIRQTADAGYLVAGNSWDYITYMPSDVWLVKLSKSGMVQFQETYGTPNGDDWMYSMEVTTEGDCVFAGRSDSIGTHGQIDGWIVKTGPLGERPATTQSIIENSIPDNSISIYPNPASSEIRINITENIRDLPYTVFDQSGKSVMKGKLSDFNGIIKIDNLSKGIYILSIGDKIKTNRRFIKE
ncbi:MAG TPA: T9SS type A sorting domain-containing protein [Flavobacterium sp.]|uniref:T9SS type A sorting domain-containing protein n=1 Tax=Flavobacterium sp. TaxID=239 RepID=UPI002C2FF42F|nr:T9SS type A sorting domain-containing protein [Flavobacterium sp.]HSD14744.1 T9SS type A sorting domain-containing protein [Flavobacterium sp.]